MKLVKIYEGILRALSVIAHEDGTLYYNGLSTTVPWTLSQEDRRHIVLPTQEILRAGEFDKVAPWHPMSEHLNRGVSPIMRATVRTATIRLTEVILSLMEQFIELGLDTERQLKMAPAAQKVLGVVKAVDARSLKDFHKIVGKMVESKANDLSPISLYLKREGIYNGVRSRVCAVSSPLLIAVEDSERKPGGVSIRVNDQSMLENLIEYILPGIADTDTYSAPSSSKTAPYFDSFLGAYEKVATQLNKVIHVNRKELKDVEKLRTNLDWGNLSEDLQTHRSEVPPLEDSKGKLLDSENTDVNGAEPIAAPAPAGPSMYGSTARPTPAPAVVHAQPYVAPTAPATVAVAPAEDESNLSMAERLMRRQMQAAYPAAPVPGAYPGAPVAAPPYNPYAPQAQPAVMLDMYGRPVYPPQGQPVYPTQGAYPGTQVQMQPAQPLGYNPYAPQAAPTYHIPANQPQPGMMMDPYGRPVYPGAPMGVDPNAPPWMGASNSTVAVGSSPQPAPTMYQQQPQYYGQQPVAGTPVPDNQTPALYR